MVRRPTGPGDEARVLRLLERALELAPDERDTYLAENCGTGTALRQRIDRLIELETKGELVPPDGVMPLADTPPSDARPAPRAGDRFGAWQLVEPLGSGGMGEVWSARRADGSFERDVAIKVVPRDGGARRPPAAIRTRATPAGTARASGHRVRRRRGQRGRPTLARDGARAR